MASQAATRGLRTATSKHVLLDKLKVISMFIQRERVSFLIRAASEVLWRLSRACSAANILAA